MMTLKIYADLLSQPSRAVLIFCRAANIPHQFNHIRLTRLQNKTQAFSKLSPFKTVSCFFIYFFLYYCYYKLPPLCSKVPVVVDGDQPIRDSNAALRYMARLNQDIPDHWYPKDPLEQARVDEYLHWAHVNTRSNLAMYFQVGIYFPKRNLFPFLT